MMNGKYNFFYYQFFWRPWSTISSLVPSLMYFEWVPFSYRLISVAVFLEGNLVTLNHGSRITKVLGDLKPIQAKFGMALMSLSGLLHSFCESEIWVSPSLLRRIFSRALFWIKSLHILQGISICSHSPRCNKLYSHASVNNCTPQKVVLILKANTLFSLNFSISFYSSAHFQLIQVI